MTSPTIRDLGSGLVLRRATVEDAEALGAFNAFIHGNPEENRLDERVRAWTVDLMTRPHPTTQAGDFTIVEDTATGKIVSSMNLISQTWSYEGVRFGVGRPELVGTHPDYRNKGLVRAQFDLVHQWSAERGEMVQAITGIPYYYRLFGYEMALELGGGKRGSIQRIPALAAGKSEPYVFRPAVEADLPFIAEMFEQNCRRSMVSCVWDMDLWRCELLDKSANNVNRMVLVMIETPASEPVGFLAHMPYRWDRLFAANVYELKPGISWGAVTPSVMRYLKAQGEKLPCEHSEVPLSYFGFWMGTLDHPVYRVLPDSLEVTRRPYAWYIRVPDLAGFIRHIAPVLERRLAESPLTGHSGDLTLTFYRDGLCLAFEKGRLARAEPWKPFPVGGAGRAGFPGLTFLQLLFGYRSLEDLMYAFPDCWTDSDETKSLLNALFPRKPSDFMPVA